MVFGLEARKKIYEFPMSSLIPGEWNTWFIVKLKLWTDSSFLKEWEIVKNNKFYIKLQVFLKDYYN